MGIQYWHKPINETSYTDVTSLISVPARGNKSINNTPETFEFSIQPYAKILGETVLTDLDVNIGDEFCITLDLLNCLAYGKVLDPGREMITFSKSLGKAICKFNVICVDPPFGKSVIDEINLNSDLVEVLDELMLYADESIGVSGIGKYKLNFTSYSVLCSITKKILEEAITDLCSQNGFFWQLKKLTLPDDDEGIIVKRYLDFSDTSGTAPEEDSTWYDGINNENVIGVIANPIFDNLALVPRVASDSKFKLSTDPSVILNSIEISAKIYESSTGVPYRYSTIAQPGKVDYELDGYASDVTYVGLFTPDEVKVLEGSTATTLKLASRYCTNIEVGNIANLPSHPTYFAEVSAIDVLDSSITEISFTENLPWTPEVGELFEIVGNVDIWRKESEIPFDFKGCVIDIDKKNYAKVKFLDLSEPPPGQKIIFHFQKIKDLPLRLENEQSKQDHGLKYDLIKLDDDFVFTTEELNTLCSKLMVLEPQQKISFESLRYGMAPIGLSITVNVTNYVNRSFILKSLAWEIIGKKDPNGKPLIRQFLEFETYLLNREKVLERYKKITKKTTSFIDDQNKYIQKEAISAGEKIFFTLSIVAPEAPTGVSVEILSSTSVKVSWDAVEYASVYHIYLSTDGGATWLPGYGAGGLYDIFVVDLVGDPEATLIDLDLDANTYSLFISAENVGGESPLSDEVEFSGLTAPDAPTGLTATWTNTTASLSFSPSVGADSYKVYIYDGGTPIAGYNGKVIYTTTESVTGLSENKTYTWKVKATNGAGDSAFSSEESFKTQILLMTAVANDSVRNYYYTYKANGTGKARITSQNTYAEGSNDSWGAVSTNGRYFSYSRPTASSTYALFVYDFQTNTEVQISPVGSATYGYSAWNPADPNFVYCWKNFGTASSQIVKLSLTPTTEMVLASPAVACYELDFNSDGTHAIARVGASGICRYLTSSWGSAPSVLITGGITGRYNHNFTKILFSKLVSGFYQVHDANVDGTSQVARTTGSVNKYNPAQQKASPFDITYGYHNGGSDMEIWKMTASYTGHGVFLDSSGNNDASTDWALVQY